MSKRKRNKEDILKPQKSKKARTDGAASSPEDAARDGAPDIAAGLEGEAASSDGRNGGTSMEPFREASAGSLRPEGSLRWTSRTTGGRILDLDPIFTVDQEHYILAYTLGVRVFSCKTSQLVQSLPIARDTSIVGLAVAPSNPSELVIGLANGRIIIWHWLDNVERAQLDVQQTIQALAVATQLDGETPRDIIYVAQDVGSESESESESSSAIYAYCLDDDSGRKGRVVCQSDTAVQTLQVVGNGRALVATSGHRVILATKRAAKYFPIETLRYQTKEFNCTDAITSCRAYLANVETQGNQTIGVDLAVGTRSGFIYLYRDILNQLNLAKTTHLPPAVNRLHWHRNAVAALDWSRDGQYLISGGEETVLVLWQLDRAQKSFLPHLSSPIGRVVVSPSGSSYGVTLRDNSSMVLKVLTLEPETSIAEPQLFARNIVTRDLLPNTALLPSAPPVLPRYRSPIAVAHRSAKLLFATKAPSHWGGEGKVSSPSPFLHIFDYKSSKEITRQALARTLVTDRKVGPRGLPLEEPSVALLKISADEQWLATVDEWFPMNEEFNGVSGLLSHWRATRLEAFESYMRFWKWREATRTWDLMERVDLAQSMHTHPLRKSKVVLDLIPGPEPSTFYTLGDDFVIRRWAPSQRTRTIGHGQDASPSEEWSWSCSDVGALPVLSGHEEMHHLTGRIAVSHDGSLLLAATSTSRASVVCLIDLRSRAILSTEYRKTSGGIRFVGLVGSCAVALSDIFAVWNVVDLREICRIELRHPTIPRDQVRAHFHVACDEEQKRFAVVSPTDDGSTVYSVDCQTLEQHTVAQLPFRVLAFLHAPTSHGFLAVNVDSEMTVLSHSSPSARSANENEVSLPERPAPAVGLSGVFGSLAAPVGRRVGDDDARGTRGEAVASDGRLISLGGDGLMTKAENADVLRRMFEASQPLASPSVTTMFHQVAAVMSRDMRDAA